MQVRRFVPETDFDELRCWCSDERIHALWCAGRFPFPLEREGFEKALSAMNDAPYTALDDSGVPVGFFCLSFNSETMLKFVLVKPDARGQGVGRKMIRLAADTAFENPEVRIVRLNVFSVNVPAERCYLSAGFAVESVTPEAFRYKDEVWGRCSMTLARKD